MAKKHKSKEVTSIGAKPIPCGGEPDPYQIALFQDRIKRDRQRIFQEIQGWFAEDDKRQQLYELADKGFQEAGGRRNNKRWGLLGNTKKAENDLPQAVCILLMFHDCYQERQGLADFEEPLISLEIQFKYKDVVSELRESVSYCFGPWDDVDLFMACMVQIRKCISVDFKKSTQASKRTIKKEKKSMHKPRGRNPKYLQEKLKLALKSYNELIGKMDSKAAWNKVAEMYDFPSGEAARKPCEKLRRANFDNKSGQN